jgi:hypothetical protein
VKTVEQLARAFRADAAAATRELAAEYACIKEPLQACEFLLRVIEAMGDGTGAIMLDGKMEDDASCKQCRVIVALARQLAAADADLAATYGF